MNGKLWTPAQLELLKRLYPDRATKAVAKACRHPVASVYHMAAALGLKKSASFHADAKKSGRFNKLTKSGIPHRFPPGHAPANKGLRRPGWSVGRMRETQFKKGQFPPNKDPDFYVLGALRVNADGYIDMRVSFAPGACGWRALHRILWEDAHGPIPRGHIVTFKNRDKLDVELDNLELITLADNFRRNSVHNLPPALKQSIQLLGALKRTINRRTRNEKQNRGSEGSPVCNTGGSPG